MEEINKYLNDKVISIMGIVSGAIAALIGLIIFVLQEGALGMGILGFLFWISVLACIGCLASSIYVLATQSKSVGAIAETSVQGVLLIVLFMSKGVIDVFAATSLEGLFSAALSVYNASSKVYWLLFAIIVGIAAVVISVLVLLGKLSIMEQTSTDGVNLPEIDTEKLKEDAKVATDAVKKTTGELIVKAKAFFQTKNGKITLGGIGIGAVLLIGLFIFFTFFNKTSVDLTSQIVLEYDGYSGAGTARIAENNVEYDINNADIALFVNSTYYDITPSTGLKNGDTVTVNAVYSPELASQYKISVKNETREFTVEGLEENYADAQSIDSATLDALKADSETAVKAYVERLSLANTKVTYLQSFLVKNKTEGVYDSDYFVGVYQIDGTEENWWNDETKQVTYYIKAEYRGLGNHYTQKEKDLTIYGSYSCARITEAGSWSNYLTDPSKIEGTFSQYDYSEYQVLAIDQIQVTTPTTPEATDNSSDYVLENSSTTALTEADLENLTAEQLKIARNEIYARKGYIFKDEELQKYFEGKSWYKGTIQADDFNEDMLSEIEKNNAELIRKKAEQE